MGTLAFATSKHVYDVYQVFQYAMHQWCGCDGGNTDLEWTGQWERVLRTGGGGGGGGGEG